MLHVILFLWMPWQNAPAPGQAPEAKPAAPAPKSVKEDLSWPKLAPQKMEELQAKIALYKRAIPEKSEALGKEIISLGKGAVPVLLLALGKAEPEQRARFVKVLDQLTEATDLPRLLGELGSKAAVLRQYVLKRASIFSSAAHAPALEKSLQDEDGDCRFYAALSLAHAGSLAGLSLLQSEANSRWDLQRKEILKALEGVRGPEASKKLLPSLNNKEDDSTLAALRLLAGCGDSSAVTGIYFFLDSANNRFKEEAVNALRGILDKAPPVENLSVFDLIEQANQWKARLGGKKN